LCGDRDKEEIGGSYLRYVTVHNMHTAGYRYSKMIAVEMILGQQSEVRAFF